MRKKGFAIVIILAVAFLVFIVLQNIFVLKNNDFWKTSFVSAGTLIVAVIFGYILVRRDHEIVKRKEIYVKILEKFQAIISDTALSKITDDSDISLLLMQKRNMSNYILILDKYAEQYSIKQETDFIKDKLAEYTELLGNHQDDIEYLKRSEKELLRPLMLIDSKISEIMMKLFD